MFAVLRWLSTGIMLCVTASALAQSVVLEHTPPPRPPKLPLWIPYGFSTEATDLAAGVLLANSIAGQVQAFSIATAWGSSNGSYGAYLLLNDLQFADESRWYFQLNLGASHFDQRAIWVDGNPAFPDQRAGSHDSDISNAILGEQDDYRVDVSARYILPIGFGKNRSLPHFETRDGALISEAAGGEVWNPLRSGITTLELRLFGREQDTVPEQAPPTELSTNGLMVGLDYDNTDFPRDPARGSRQTLRLWRDFGAGESDESWTFLELDLAKYLAFGDGRHMRQRVLALNAWYGYSPTWDVVDTPIGPVIENGPPHFMGATVGGLYHQRGYPYFRFHDKAAVNYAAELRLTPHKNPLREWPLIRNFDLRNWQIVPFVELGRVAESFSDLHSDLNWTAGAGFRFNISGAMVRVDLAFSSEDWAWWVMGNHTY